MESFEVKGMMSSLEEFGEGPGARGTQRGVPFQGARNHRFRGKRTGTAASTLDHRESKNVTAVENTIADDLSVSRSACVRAGDFGKWCSRLRESTETI